MRAVDAINDAIAIVARGHSLGGADVFVGTKRWLRSNKEGVIPLYKNCSHSSFKGMAMGTMTISPTCVFRPISFRLLEEASEGVGAYLEMDISAVLNR